MVTLNEWLSIVEECLHQELELGVRAARRGSMQRRQSTSRDGGTEKHHRAVKRIASQSPPTSSSVRDTESSSRRSLSPSRSAAVTGGSRSRGSLDLYSIIDSRARSASREGRYSKAPDLGVDTRNGVRGFRVEPTAENRESGGGNRNGKRNIVAPRYEQKQRSASAGPMRGSVRGSKMRQTGGGGGIGGGGEMLDKGVWVGVGVGRSVIADRTSYVPSFSSSSMKSRVGHFKSASVPSNHNTSQERHHPSTSIRYRGRDRDHQDEDEERIADYDRNDKNRSLRKQRDVEIEDQSEEKEEAALKSENAFEFMSKSSTEGPPQDAPPWISEGLGDWRDVSQTTAVSQSYSCTSAIAASHIAKMRCAFDYCCECACVCVHVCLCLAYVFETVMAMVTVMQAVSLVCCADPILCDVMALLRKSLIAHSPKCSRPHSLSDMTGRQLSATLCVPNNLESRSIDLLDWTK